MIPMVAVMLALLSAGCLPLSIAGHVTYREAVRKGEAPPPEVGRTCMQEGTVRGASGEWVYDQKATQACFAREGWVTTGRTNSLGQPIWTQTGNQ